MFTSPSAQDLRARQLSVTTTPLPPPQEPRPLNLILLVDVRLMSFVLRFWGRESQEGLGPVGSLEDLGRGARARLVSVSCLLVPRG